MSKKIPFFILLTVVFVAALYFLLRPRSTSTSSLNQIRVVTSFYPLYFFTQAIGGQGVSVTNITPVGAEPHDYEPTTQDVINIESSRLLVVNGLVEPWLSKLKPDLLQNHVQIIETSSGQSAQDPHIWLDPVLAKSQVDEITSGLISLDPVNRNLFTSNSTELKSRLDQLDQDYRTGLSNCSLRQFVTSHAAFGYLATRYNLTPINISGISPDQEPSPKQLADISNLVKSTGIKYVFFESLISPRMAETIARETGAKTLVLNPLEGLTPEEQTAGADYFSISKANLENLRIALNCQ